MAIYHPGFTLGCAQTLQTLKFGFTMKEKMMGIPAVKGTWKYIMSMNTVQLWACANTSHYSFVCIVIMMTPLCQLLCLLVFLCWFSIIKVHFSLYVHMKFFCMHWCYVGCCGGFSATHILLYPFVYIKQVLLLQVCSCVVSVLFHCFLPKVYFCCGLSGSDDMRSCSDQTLCISCVVVLN